MDAHIIADLHLEHAEPLVQALSGAFYVDVESIRKSIRTRRRFNAIHLETLFQVNISVQKQRPFDESQFARRTEQIVATEPERRVFIASAEDTILSKLEWYRLSGESSEQQWRDVLGIIRLQGEHLDRDYLHHWATQIGVVDLLERTRQDAE